MRFSYDFTVPADTSETNPYTGAIRLDTGTLTSMSIRFKSGCHNRVFVAIFDALQQIIPAHETAALYGNDTTFTIPMQYVIAYKPFELTFKGWSPNTRYPHTISVWGDLYETAIEKKTGGISQLLHLLGASGQ